MKNSKIAGLILLPLCLTLLGSGCVSADPDKLSAQIMKWVPIGTPEKQAEKIMKRKGFDCQLVKLENPFNSYKTDYIQCDRVQVWFHDWSVCLFIKDGKVSEYGPATID